MNPPMQIQHALQTIQPLLSQFAGSDESSARIRKVIETTEKKELSSFAGILQRCNTGNVSPDPSPIKHRTTWANVFSNLCAADGNIHIEDMVRVADAGLREVKSKLDSAFAAAGIPNSPAVNFGLDRQGRAVLVGDHPQKKQIDQLLCTNDELETELRSAMINKEIAVSTQRGAIYVKAYQDAYIMNGKAAAGAIYERYMAMGSPNTSFLYDNSGLIGFFDGKTDQAHLADFKRRLLN
jgi:hypothetical protein